MTLHCFGWDLGNSHTRSDVMQHVHTPSLFSANKAWPGLLRMNQRRRLSRLSRQRHTPHTSPLCRPFPTNGKRMVYLDNMSPRGQEQASHALYGACGRFGEPLGASWGLRRASNGFEHGLPARTVKRFGTVSVQVLGVAPRGFPLAEKSLPTDQGTCGRLSAATGSRAWALWALRVAIPAPHELSLPYVP